MHDLTITLVQTPLHWENVPANLEHFDRLLGNKLPSDLIILPEMFNTGFITNPGNLAEDMEGPTMAWMRKKSSELKAALCGSLIVNENGNYYNRLIFITPDGSVQHYDKRHLFTMAGEHLHFSSGKKRIVISYRDWNILPLVCYDLRFPVWSKNRWMDGSYEYDLLIYIANWPEARRHAWRSLLTARAIENLCFVAAVNRIGKDGNGLIHSGDSVVLSPKGHAVLSLPAHHEMVHSVTLSRIELTEFREKFNVGPDWDRCRLTTED